ncbi:MAG: hypothetical protein PVH88_03600 [Ignavibacteria bacterium]|jgi:hypothetical protein
MEIVNFARRILKDFAIKLNDENFRVKTIEKNNHFYSVNLEQTFKNLPVGRSEIGYTLYMSVNLIMLGADKYPDIQISTAPNISYLEEQNKLR